MSVTIKFVVSLMGAISLSVACACAVGAQTGRAANRAPAEDGNLVTKIDGLEKRTDQGFTHLQSEMQAQNQIFANTAYHHLLIATAFMAMATLFVVGITIFTGINTNASRTEFREHLAGLGNDFRVKLTEQTKDFKEQLGDFRREVEQVHKENHEQTSELKATAVSLNGFKESMEKDFNDMKTEFEKMRNQFKPAKEILNNVHAEFEKPGDLKQETVRDVILLLLDNPGNSEEYKLQLENELQRLGGSAEPRPNK
jgi:hypothetical protein